MKKSAALPESKRLIYRELVDEDAARVYQYANDQSINRYLIFGELASLDGAANYVATARANAAKPVTERRSFKLALLSRTDHEFIGSCWLDITAAEHRRATLGYFIDNRQWQKGYATEAATALVAFGFQVLGLHRIEATCDPENPATIRVLTKAGFKQEALMRQKRRRGPSYHDLCLYAVLAPDQPAKPGQEL